MTGSVDMFPDAAIEYLIEHAEPKPKPRIKGETDETTLTTWDHSFRRTVVSTRWIVSCPCHLEERWAIAVVPSWEAALEIVKVHLEREHRDT